MYKAKSRAKAKNALDDAKQSKNLEQLALAAAVRENTNIKRKLKRIAVRRTIHKQQLVVKSN